MFRCSGDISPAAATSSALGPGCDARRARIDARQRFANEAGPGRIRRRFRQQRAPDRGRFLRAPVLLGGKPEEIARPDVARIEAKRALERRLGLGGDDAVLRAGQRLAEIGLALRRSGRAAAAHSPRLHRVVVAPKPHIDRPEHLPAAAILRILLQMRLDPADQFHDRALLGSAIAPRRLRLPVSSGEPSVR